ncbi:MAG: PD40 domain-containing protein [Anaerolineae bacterium]|nr:PD40 domain-containing protein [Gemmatimonadaceae bacterium]
MRPSWVYALTASMLAAAPLSAQQYFGKNQVQYDHFDWKVIETEHFLVHYYPAEQTASRDASRMAERAHGRLSRIFQHEFREKKPIVLYASRTDFGQNNVLGDLGEGVGGVTEALRHRILMPFTGDYGSFEQVLTHEMVHEFQYDIFARGKAGGGLQNLAQVNLPLWFAEGMAEYLSTGPVHPHTATWLRDAALNGNLPTIEEMTQRPDIFFPYRFGEALWAYIGQRWGDEVIGAIMQAAPNVGVERAFRREIGKTLEELSDEWREAMQTQHLPQVAQLERARKFSSQTLSERKTGGQIFIAPALSSDGKYIAFLSNGRFSRGEVFIDLWLGDARTGKRIRRLVKSTTNPDVEELRILYSQSSFSQDGKRLAFVGQRKGKDVLYMLDVKKSGNRVRIDLPVEGVTNPSWSPDGRQLVFSGNTGGITDLYIVDANGKNLRRLTNDKFGDLQPTWSPDGKTIAFASDRGEKTDFDRLVFSKWQIALYHLDGGRIERLPNQDGLNINPVWAPDGRSIAFVSDRTGIQNLFLYDLDDSQHYQLTNVIGGISSFSEYSPVISWARQADRLAYTYFEDGDYTVWSVDNPRLLKKSPFQPTASPELIARRAQPANSSTIATVQATTVVPPLADTDSALHSSVYRTPGGFRPSADAPRAGEGTTGQGPITVAALLDSALFALPDTTKFKRYNYKVRFSPDYVARPEIGYARDNYGRGVFGGTTIILSDLLGNHSLAFSGEVNGRISEARAFAGYTNLSRRLQFSTGLYQEPYFFAQGYSARLLEEDPSIAVEEQIYTRYIQRQAFGIGIYPLNRFTRGEFGLRLTNLDRSDIFVSQAVQLGTGLVSPLRLDSTVHGPSINYAQPYAAYVSDNILFGYTGPIMGRRYRFQITPTVGTYQWMEYLADYRRYDPIIFNFLTVATRALGNVSVGRDADSLRRYIGYPEIVRGYDRDSYRVNANDCATAQSTEFYKCSPLFGSRLLVGNAELRFPLLRRVDIGILPISLPPIEGLVFYDAAVTWFDGQDVNFRGSGSSVVDPSLQRSLLRSYGFGVRVNLFGFALLRWDYAIPQDGPSRGNGYWRFSLGPSF